MSGYPSWYWLCTHEPICDDRHSCYDLQRDDAAIDAEDQRREEEWV